MTQRPSVALLTAWKKYVGALAETLEEKGRRVLEELEKVFQ